MSIIPLVCKCSTRYQELMQACTLTPNETIEHTYQYFIDAIPESLKNAWKFFLDKGGMDIVNRDYSQNLELLTDAHLLDFYELVMYFNFNEATIAQVFGKKAKTMNDWVVEYIARERLTHMYVTEAQHSIPKAFARIHEFFGLDTGMDIPKPDFEHWLQIYDAIVDTKDFNYEKIAEAVGTISVT